MPVRLDDKAVKEVISDGHFGGCDVKDIILTLIALTREEVKP